MVMVNMINVTIQHSVPNELRGRVMSLYVTVFAGSVPIGGFLAGGVAELWDAPAGFVLGGALSVAFIGLAAWQLVIRPSTDADAAAGPPSDGAGEAQRRAANQ